MNRPLIFAASLLLLSGCAEYLAAAGAIDQQAIAAKRTYNDLQRDTVTAAVCETTLGAHFRDPDTDARYGREVLCGGGP